MGEEDEVSVNTIPLWSNCLIPANGGSNLGYCLRDVGQALLLCLEAGASGQRRRKEDSQVAREGHLVPGTGLGISGGSWSPAPSASRFGPLADSSQGRGRNTQPTCQLGPPPESGAFLVLAPEAAQGHLRDGHPGRNQCVT